MRFNPPFLLPHPGVLALFVLITPLWIRASTEKCLNDPDFYQYLSGTLEPNDPTKKQAFLLPCDTMVINRKILVTILPNTYLAWEDPKPNNLLIVKGILVAAGTAQHNIQISSTHDSTFYNPDLFKGKWQGIQIKEGGKVILEHVNVYGAPQPIFLDSGNLQIENSLFYNSQNFKLKGLPEYQLPQNHHISNFDYQKLLSQKASKPITNKSAQKSKLFSKDLWANPWTIIVPGSAAFLGIAIWWVATQEPETKEQNLGAVKYE